MISHCKDVAESGAQAIVQNVHIYSQDRPYRYMLLVIRGVPELVPVQNLFWEQEQVVEWLR